MNSPIRALRISVLILLTFGICDRASAAPFDEVQKLLADDGASFDDFGVALAIDGDTAVIGSRLDNDNGSDSGSAYVFTRQAGVWTQQQKLTPADGAAFDLFGMRVAIDADTVVIGAEADDDDGASSGAAYVFTRSAGVWTEQQKLTADDAAEGDWFGSAVAVEGDVAVIGAERDDDNGTNSGSAYVFTRSAGVWNQQQKLTASNGDAFDDFGNSMAIDGDTLVIGARYGDIGTLFSESDFGTAYVFTNNGGMWTEQQMLMASDGAYEDEFGVSVAVDGDTVVVGAPSDDDNGASSGSAYVFTRDAGMWTEQQKLTASDGLADSEFGESVGVDGSTVVVGAWLDGEAGNEAGAAYVYMYASGAWTEQQKVIASDAEAFDNFGQTVAIAHDVSMIGSTRDDDNGSASGSAYVFALDVARFGDVAIDYWARDFIETLAASGITAGCGGDNYCPEDIVTRAQMAVFLERGMNGSQFVPPPATGNIFLDVASSDFAASFIEQLFLDGITSGCGGNNYCPSDSVTRAQMAVFLLRARHGAGFVPAAPTGVFNDVDLGHWAVAWIEQLAAEGITSGCGNGNYCPDNPVTRAQMAVFLVRTFDL